MDEVLMELAKQLNLPQLIVIGLLFWFFYSRLDKKIEKLDEKLSSKIEKLDEKVNSIDKRLFAVEAILQMKECCMLRDDSQLKKAE